MNILIYFSLLLSLSITFIAGASRSPLAEIEEGKKVTSLETLHRIMLREYNRERGVRPGGANSHITPSNGIFAGEPKGKRPNRSLVGAPAANGMTMTISMRRPRITAPITEEDVLKAAQEKASYIREGVLCSLERLRIIGSFPSYNQDDFSAFLTPTHTSKDFRELAVFRDISRFCLVSKLWNKAFNNKAFLLGHFPQLEHVNPENYGAKTPLGALKLFNGKRFDDLTEQRRVVENAALARAFENVLRIPELVRIIGFSLSYEDKAYEEFWVLSDIKNFCLVSKLWNRTFSEEKFLIDRFPHLEQEKQEERGEKSLLGMARLLAKSGFTKVWLQDSAL